MTSSSPSAPPSQPGSSPEPPRKPFVFSRAGFAALPAPAQGALWMLLAAAGFAFMTVLVRVLSAEMHSFEIAFFRNLFGLLPMVPWMLRSRFRGLRASAGSMRKYGLRALLGIVAMFAWFNAIAHVPLADATSLSFLAPIFTTIMAIAFLGERAGVRRWSAILIGFVGAIVILRPGFQEIHPASILQIFGCASVAGATIMVKVLSRTESSSAIVTYMGIYMVPMSLVPALFVWQTPAWHLWPTLVAMGVFATLGQWAMTQAYAVADATVVLPFDYARLPFVAAIGFFAFGEHVDLLTWAGGAIIAAAAIYIAQRESKKARRYKVAGETIGVPAGPGPIPNKPIPNAPANEADTRADANKAP